MTRAKLGYKKGTVVLTKVHAFWNLRIQIFVLSTLQLRSSNLTIGESFFGNSSDGRSHSFYGAARSRPSYYQVPVHISAARPLRVSILDFPFINSPTHNPTITSKDSWQLYNSSFNSHRAVQSYDYHYFR